MTRRSGAGMPVGEHQPALASLALGAVLDVCPDLALAVDGSGRIVAANRLAVEAMGRPADEIVGCSPVDFVHPTDQALAGLALLSTAARPGVAAPIELRVAMAQGWRLLEIVACNLLDDPSVGAVIMTGRDRTEEQDTAPEQAARMRTLVDSTDDLLLLVDDAWNVQFANRAVTRVLGRDPEDMLGRSFVGLVAAADQSLAAAELEVVAATTGVQATMTLRLSNAAGGEGTFNVRALNLSDDPSVAAILLSAHDVTELVESVAAERDAIGLLRAVFDLAPVGISVIGLDGVLEQVNQAVVDLSGYPSSELVGRPASDLLEEAERDRAAQAVVPLLEGTSRIITQELKLRRGDGDHVWIRGDTSVVRDDRGTPVHLVSMMVDITNTVRRTESLAHRATHDPLTGLANRSVLIDALGRAVAHAARGETHPAVLLIDLDGFKAVNDSFGHAAGDDLLIRVARRISEQVRTTDLVIRHGGDEFVVLCDDVHDDREAIDVAERIRTELTEPFMLAEGTAHVGATIGLATVSGDESPETVLRVADRALYEGKAKGRGCVVVSAA